MNVNLAMIWTTNKPTKSGWYWHRPTPETPPYPVKIFNANHIVYVWPVNDHGSREDNVTMRLSDCTGEFAGPLEPVLTTGNRAYMREVVEALTACRDRLQFIHSRLVPHNYATVADGELHDDVHQIEACLNRAADVLDKASLHVTGPMEPPA